MRTKHMTLLLRHVCAEAPGCMAFQGAGGPARRTRLHDGGEGANRCVGERVFIGQQIGCEGANWGCVVRLFAPGLVIRSPTTAADWRL
jgi:hypothetical protein